MSDNLLSDEPLCKRLDAVEWHNHKSYKLGDMYRGAIQALKSSNPNCCDQAAKSSNPDSCAQAANSLRELAEKLIRTVTGRELREWEEFKNMRKKLEKLREEYERNKKDETLENLLTKLDEYIELSENPPMKETIAEALGGGRGVTPEVQVEEINQAMKLMNRLQSHAHHRVDTNQDKIREELDGLIEKLKKLLLRILDSQDTTKQNIIKGILKYNE